MRIDLRRNLSRRVLLWLVGLAIISILAIVLANADPGAGIDEMLPISRATILLYLVGAMIISSTFCIVAAISDYRQGLMTADGLAASVAIIGMFWVVAIAMTRAALQYDGRI